MMLGPEDLVLMLNMGWSLQEIADHAGMRVKTVEQVIVAQAKAERLTAQFLFIANVSRPQMFWLAEQIAGVVIASNS